MKIIIFILTIALIAVTVLFLRHKLVAYTFAVWMVENNCPIPQKQDLERIMGGIIDNLFKH